MSVASEVKETVKEVASGPKTLVKGFTAKPWLAASVALTTLVLVVVVEMFRPGMILDPIRRGVMKIGKTLGLVKG